MAHVRLDELITDHLRRQGESYRDLERRSKDAGHPISRSRLNTFGNQHVLGALPAEDTRTAIAAALGVSVDTVTAAALESAGIDELVGDGRSLQHAEAWLRLTAGRSEIEIQHLLGVVSAALKAMEAVQRDDSGAPD